MSNQPLMWSLGSASQNLKGGIPYYTNFPWAVFKIFLDRIEIKGPPTCNLKWSEITYIDLRNTGIEIVTDDADPDSRITFASIFNFKNKVANIIIENDLPVSMKSYHKNQIREYVG